MTGGLAWLPKKDMADIAFALLRFALPKAIVFAFTGAWTYNITIS
jgi:hypothetical protein